MLENIKAAQKVRESLKAEYPNVLRLYPKLIERRHRAQAGARNAFIVQAVPFLYRAVAPPVLLQLVGLFYDCNRALFNDPRDQHMKEASAMLESVARTYLVSLAEGERRIYEELPSKEEQDAFRICRDLALLEDPEKDPYTFFMSCNGLGDRLGIYPTQAQRIMWKLESYRLVEQLAKGVRRAQGVPGVAGEYRWLLAVSSDHNPGPVPAGA